ncbi:hypothetical protein [Nocardia mexicana]|uniref:Uncharacterized protein n=1 Tax=Nocardia mexicana TaxID=279262 RepID=A0A370HBX0_9NOCA|nr:hypothetical protein [Nocardia mexicana]RDI53991.1 hypothetical protein DFR68_102112 [Nocardia mexicana]
MKTTNYATTAEQQYGDVLELLADHGYEPALRDIGSGCFVISIKPVYDYGVLIADKDGPLFEQRSEQTGWTVGFYSPEADITDALIAYAETDNCSAEVVLRILERIKRESVPVKKRRVAE